MKTGRYLQEIISVLDELGLVQKATLIQKASLPDEKIFRKEKILEMQDKDFENSYLSLIIVKQRGI